MFSPMRSLKERFIRYATALRFPRLLMLTLGLFAVDFFVPDVIPFVDEILLALVAAGLAMLKKSRRERVLETAPVPDARGAGAITKS